jgi:hypothetical protein
MLVTITESSIEQYAINLLVKQGYQYIYGPDIASDAVFDLPPLGGKGAELRND